MRRFWSTFRLSLLLSLLIGVLFYMALHRHYPEWRTLHLINTSLSGVMAMVSVVAASLFVYSMRSYKKALRRAYALLCIGIVIFGLAQVQFPVASYIDAYFWYQSGLIGVPYLAAVVFIFLGVRAEAGILKLNTRWASFKWLLGTATVVSVLVALLPHAASDLSPVQLVGSNVLSAIDTVFMMFAVMTIMRIRQSLGPRYVHAMTWLAVAFGINVLAGIHYIVVNLVTTSTFNWYYYDAMSTVPFFIASWFFVYAGYAMVMVDPPEREVTVRIPTENTIMTPHGLPLVDMITYLASLASKPQEIDPILDVLRGVTAGLPPDQRVLSPKDEQQLLEVYQKITHYLVTDEPLRTFTTEGLSRSLKQEFGLQPGTRLPL